MNVRELHDASKLLSAKTMSKSECGTVSSIQLLRDGLLSKHVTKVMATLICVKGKVVYEDVRGTEAILTSGDFILIEPNLEHWVKGLKRSDLVLIR